MSRAFTKEDQAQAPLVVPRAPLPEGVPNYVTSSGFEALRKERAALESERARLLTAAPEGELAGEVAAYGERLASLDFRIRSAVVVDPRECPSDQVRFSAEVSLISESGEKRRYRLVGVDEADAASGRIAFVAPLARALLGKRVGDRVTVRTSRGEEELEVERIEY